MKMAVESESLFLRKEPLYVKKRFVRKTSFCRTQSKSSPAKEGGSYRRCVDLFAILKHVETRNAYQ